MLMKKLITLALMLTAFCGVSMADDTYTVVGNLSIFGSWDVSSSAGDMNKISETSYSRTFKAVTFSSNTTIEFKVVKNHAYGNGSWPSSNYTHNFDAGVYDITISFDTSTETVGYSDVGRNYIVYSTNNFSSHTVGNLMDYEDGVHTGTITADDGCSFLIVPSYALNSTQTAISNWSKVICPVSDEWYAIYFEHMSGTASTSNNEKKWYIHESAQYTITYSGTTFSIDAEATVNVTSAGWATYSLGSGGTTGYTISGADAFYIASTADGKATLTSIASGKKIPVYPDGIMLKKIGGGDVTITTTASSDVTLTDNMLQGSGRYTNWNLNNSGYTGYYLNNGASGLGFYPAATGNMAAHKAFLRVPTGSARDFFSFDEETTGIKQTKANVQQTYEYFNLAGQKVAQPTKGLYIVNGKKVIIK